MLGPFIATQGVSSIEYRLSQDGLRIDIRHTEVPGNIHTGFRQDHLVDVLHMLITPPEEDPDWVKPINLVKAHVQEIAEQMLAKHAELVSQNE